MATLVSNQDLGVTTTTSDHVAKTDGATDINWDPAVKVQVPHINEAKLTDATGHTSDKTKFGGGKVVRLDDPIGPPSGPPHPDNGAGGGVGSKTHLKEAKITEASPNVVTEGKGVGRSTDPTSQNHENATGSVKGPDPAEEKKRLDEEKKLACSFDLSKATCGEHGREAGTDDPKKPKILEVVTPDTITLDAKRKNAKEASKGPECSESPNHMKWVVSKWRTGKKLREETFNGDVKKLAEDWFSWNGLPGVVGLEGDSKQLKSRKQAKEALRKERAAARAADGKPPIKGPAKNDMYRETMAEAKKGDAATKQTTSRIDGAEALVSTGISLYQFLQVWNAYDDPVEVKVEGFACSGGDKYIFRSVMGDIAEFRIEKETLAKIKAAVATIERFVKIFQTIASVAGLPASFGLRLLSLPNVEFEVEWIELTAANENPKIKKYRYNVDRQWELTFEFKELIAWQGGFGVPVALFLNLFAPGAGSFLNTAMNAIGLEATVGIDIDFALMPAMWAKRDAGASVATWGGGLKVKLEVFFNLKIKWKTWLEIAGGAVLDFDIKGGCFVPGLDLWQFSLKVDGDVKIGLKGYYRVDFWWWSKSDTISYFPEQCKMSIPEFTVKALALLKG